MNAAPTQVARHGETLGDRNHKAVRDTGSRRRKRNRHRRKNRKLQKLLENLGWMAGGIAIGVPLLAVFIYFAS
jgi:hypothetical protein